jgi:hypothetical protein
MAKSRGHGAKSQELREAAILALIERRNVTEAAKACGVSERTLYRWTTKDDVFMADLTAARRAVFEAGMSRIQCLTCRAVDAIEESMSSEMPTVKLQAARTALELAAYNHERAEISDKLRTIEQYVAIRGEGSA